MIRLMRFIIPLTAPASLSLAGLLLLLPLDSVRSQPLEVKPVASFFSPFQPHRAPTQAGLILRPGDRLAICGDSITEQRMYSRAIETYLTVCVPELNLSIRQFGWSGETAAGFLARMTNDVLRFEPTIATTWYGMNDHGYRPYEHGIGDWYRENMTAIVDAFQAHDARVVLGSPGCVGKVPTWTKSPPTTVQALNLNLCELRNIGIRIAGVEDVRFADVFWPMLKAGFSGRQQYGEDYAIAGRDGVHPGWAGSFVMAHAFLKAFGLDGQIGVFEVDLAGGRATVSRDHELEGFQDGEMRIRSVRYPFCATGDAASDDSIRSAMTLVPFNEELNRLILRVRNAFGMRYRVTWGEHSREYSGDALMRGINLAADFPENPFLEAFKRVDEAVAAKQAYETRQVKQLFHGEEGRVDMEAVVALTEKARARHLSRIQEAFQPVVHTIRIEEE